MPCAACRPVPAWRRRYRRWAPPICNLQAGEGVRGAQEKPADAGELLQIWRADQVRVQRE